MRTEEIRQELRELISAHLKLAGDAVGDDTDLRTLEGVESITILESVLAIENRFGVELADEVIFSCSTVSDLAEAVQELLEDAGAPAIRPGAPA